MFSLSTQQISVIAENHNSLELCQHERQVLKDKMNLHLHKQQTLSTEEDPVLLLKASPQLLNGHREDEMASQLLRFLVIFAELSHVQ